MKHWTFIPIGMILPAVQWNLGFARPLITDDYQQSSLPVKARPTRKAGNLTAVSEQMLQLRQLPAI
jgi:hypothetical protein